MAIEACFVNLLRLLTLQIIEGRTTIEQARAIVIARAAALREKSVPRKYAGRLTRFERWSTA